MEAFEVIAIVILIIAILVLFYYYLLNSPTTRNKIRDYVPTGTYEQMEDMLKRNPEYRSSYDSDSVTKKIRVKLGDIDLSSLNTDIFTKKLDEFLDTKSEELINEWSLATTDDLSELEKKFSKTASSVDALEKDLNEFKKSSIEFHEATKDKLNDIDKKIESLENK